MKLRDADGPYELDLGSFEQVTAQISRMLRHASHSVTRLQRGVAQVLIVLSVKEPGENWQDERY